MNDYDNMSAHFILMAVANSAFDSVEELRSLESALRRKVIEEASVGVGTVRRAGEVPLPDAPQMFVPWETKDGDYDLIPKEVK